MGGRVSLGLADGAGFDEVGGMFDQVVIVIGRHEVESGRTGDVVDRLMRLSDSRENVLKFKSSVYVSFSGYDHDPRSVAEIPDCVKFFRAVHACWPFWYHFLVKDTALFGVLLTLLLDSKVVRRGENQFVHELPSPMAIQAKVLELFGPMNALYETHGIGMEENKRMSDEVCAVLSQCLR